MKFTTTLWNGLRAIALRPPRVNPVEAGPGLFLALIGAYFVVSLALDVIDVAQPWRFVSYGVLTLLTDSLLTLAAAWLMMRIMQRDGIIWGVATLLLAATIATSAVVHSPLAWAASALAERDHWVFALLLELISRWWWLPVLIGVANWLAPRHFGRAVLAGVAAFLVSAAPWWWLPAMPLLAPDVEAPVATTAPESPDDDNGDDASEPEDTTPSFDAEQVIYNQQSLLDEAEAKLKPQTPGVVDLYVIAFAGDANEDVFRNEAEYVEKLFGERFGAEGRVLVLENNAATVATRPLATLTNLSWALDDVAKKMDPAEDVLLLYMTTHGSHDHELLVDLDPLPLDQIGPDDLADALKTKPAIRWKVLVVNACYSGGFVDALRDDSTMVITSAREDRTSFGCGADSDITYFGKAFLAEGLNGTTSIPEAFAQAKKSVDAWETAGSEEHSEPQIASTRSIEAKLEAWRRALKPGAPVPFEPAKKTD
ncbi:MAG TPA: C13 family peptidase [Rhodanobacteraceae bacterium]|nr:C13 family peptidase [Rhodanobacteraceae bacterium]